MANRKIPGEFVPLDTGYFLDPRIRRAGSAAELVFLRALAFAKRAGSDGFVSPYDAEMFGVGLRSVHKSIAALVREGLFEAVEDGWVIRSWEKWNLTSSQAKEVKSARRAAAIKTNHERWHVGSDKFDPTCEHCSTDRLSDRWTDRSCVAEEEREIEGEKSREEESIGSPRSAVAAATPRHDVDRICQSLADKIESNGSRRPAITKAWRDAARLMLDHDGRTEDQILKAIDWCQGDTFWRSNILSMGKLREKYDQLRLAAQRGNETRRVDDGISTGTRRAMSAIEIGRQMQADADALNAVPQIGAS